jgi:hypothetical protein
MRKLDGKFHIENDQIIKTSNGEIIPEDEPVFLFRGRDNIALELLYNYRDLCIDHNCTEYQISGVERAINLFEEFSKNHPKRMKQPGITLGK